MDVLKKMVTIFESNEKMLRILISRLLNKFLVSNKEVEEKFDRLSDLTDNVATLNSPYAKSVKESLAEMKILSSEICKIDPRSLSSSLRVTYLNHLSFHKGIVFGIIEESRSLRFSQEKPHENYRPQIKELVQYYKEFNEWFKSLEKMSTK